MMQDPTPILTVAAAGLAAVGMIIAVALRGWQDWLDLRRGTIEEKRITGTPRRAIAELRERVRRLEAIANGDSI